MSAPATPIAASSLSEAGRIATVLGLPRAGSIDEIRLADSVAKGFPTTAASRAVRYVDPDGTFLRVTDIIPKSTLAKRQKEKKPLSKDESEKLYAFAKVAVEMSRIYHGDMQRAAQFLIAPHPLLNDRRPADLALESVAGAEVVLKLLQRADAGVTL